MEAGTVQQIQGLSRMTVGELREKYIEVFGEETRSYHKAFLRKRIAWRLQALAEGDLSDRARRRAGELANDADLRLRAFQGRDLVVQVLDDGFAFEGRRYRSLSAIAREVTGSQWNGFAFFGLTRGKKKRNHSRGSGKGNA